MLSTGREMQNALMGILTFVTSKLTANSSILSFFQNEE